MFETVFVLYIQQGRGRARSSRTFAAQRWLPADGGKRETRPPRPYVSTHPFVVSDCKKKKFLIQNAVHPKSRQRNVNTIVDCGNADSNDGKLSFPAHEGVLRGNSDVHDWTAGVWITERWNIHSHKCRLCSSWFLMDVCCAVRTISLCIQQFKMRLHCKSYDGKVMIAEQFVFHNVQRFLFSLVCHCRRKATTLFVLRVADRAANRLSYVFFKMYFGNVEVLGQCGVCVCAQ